MAWGLSGTARRLAPVAAVGLASPPPARQPRPVRREKEPRAEQGGGIAVYGEAGRLVFFFFFFWFCFRGCKMKLPLRLEFG